jgi:hypothetical protein
LLVLGGLLLLVRRPFGTDWPVAPITVLIGLVLTITRWGFPARTDAGRLEPASTLERLAVVALVIYLSFWSTAAYAGYRGTRDAARLAADPALTSAVTVYSVDDLGLQLSGARVTRLADPGLRYRYRYDDLRLLVRTGGRHLLLGDGWRQGRPVIVLSGSDSVRFEYSRHP